MVVYFILGFLLMLVLAVFLYAFRVTDKLSEHIDPEDF